MTMTAYCTIESIEKTDEGLEVVASATRDNKVRPYAKNPDATVEMQAYEVDGIISNTEGTVTSATFVFVFTGDSTSLNVGDVINLSTHFTNLQVAATEDTAQAHAVAETPEPVAPTEAALVNSPAPSEDTTGGDTVTSTAAESGV